MSEQLSRIEHLARDIYGRHYAMNQNPVLEEKLKPGYQAAIEEVEDLDGFVEFVKTRLNTTRPMVIGPDQVIYDYGTGRLVGERYLEGARVNR